MTFESEGLLIVAIYIWLPPASYVVFLTTLVIFFSVKCMLAQSSKFVVKLLDTKETTRMLKFGHLPQISYQFREGIGTVCMELHQES